MPANAAPDFFGVKMKSEDFAKNIALQENIKIPDFTNDRPGTDKRIYAYAYTSSFLGRGRGLSIQVYNHSDRDISTERLYRECVVVTRDGRRFERSQPEMEWRRDVLPSGADTTFNMVFPGVDLKNEDVSMIIFSFGLGETNIFLFPLGPRTPPVVKAKVSPKQKVEKKSRPKKVLEKKAPEKKKVPPKVVAAAPEKKTEPVKTSEHTLLAKCVTQIGRAHV